MSSTNSTNAPRLTTDAILVDGQEYRVGTVLDGGPITVVFPTSSYDKDGQHRITCQISDVLARRLGITQDHLGCRIVSTHIYDNAPQHSITLKALDATKCPVFDLVEKKTYCLADKVLKRGDELEIYIRPYFYERQKQAGVSLQLLAVAVKKRWKSDKEPPVNREYGFGDFA